MVPFQDREDVTEWERPIDGLWDSGNVVPFDFDEEKWVCSFCDNSSCCTHFICTYFCTVLCFAEMFI